MTTSTLQNIIAEAANLSYEDLIALNKAIIALARQAHRGTANAAAKFAPGQIIRFVKNGRGRHAGLHYVRITGYNRAGTCVVGLECDALGNQLPFAPKWTVAASSATLHSAK